MSTTIDYARIQSHLRLAAELAEGLHVDGDREVWVALEHARHWMATAQWLAAQRQAPAASPPLVLVG